MTVEIKNDDWVWVVVVVGPIGRDQLLGQEYSEDKISFIPTFLSKEDALKCYNQLTFEEGKKYEVQAIIYEELLEYAEANGFSVYLLNDKGEIQKRVEV